MIHCNKNNEIEINISIIVLTVIHMVTMVTKLSVDVPRLPVSVGTASILVFNSA
jgi:hypothetical protein